VIWRFPKDDPWLVIDVPRLLGTLLASAAAFSLWGWRGIVLILGLDLMLWRRRA